MKLSLLVEPQYHDGYVSHLSCGTSCGTGDEHNVSFSVFKDDYTHGYTFGSHFNGYIAYGEGTNVNFNYYKTSTEIRLLFKFMPNLKKMYILKKGVLSNENEKHGRLNQISLCCHPMIYNAVEPNKTDDSEKSCLTSLDVDVHLINDCYFDERGRNGYYTIYTDSNGDRHNVSLYKNEHDGLYDWERIEANDARWKRRRDEVVELREKQKNTKSRKKIKELEKRIQTLYSSF